MDRDRKRARDAERREDESLPPEMLLRAQLEGSSLARERLKQRVAELEAQSATDKTRHAGLEDVVSLLGRQLEAVEAELAAAIEEGVGVGVEGAEAMEEDEPPAAGWVGAGAGAAAGASQGACAPETLVARLLGSQSDGVGAASSSRSKGAMRTTPPPLRLSLIAAALSSASAADSSAAAVLPPRSSSGGGAGCGAMSARGCSAQPPATAAVAAAAAAAATTTTPSMAALPRLRLDDALDAAAVAAAGGAGGGAGSAGRGASSSSAAADPWRWLSGGIAEHVSTLARLSNALLRKRIQLSVAASATSAGVGGGAALAASSAARARAAEARAALLEDVTAKALGRARAAEEAAERAGEEAWRARRAVERAVLHDPLLARAASDVLRSSGAPDAFVEGMLEGAAAAKAASGTSGGGASAGAGGTPMPASGAVAAALVPGGAGGEEEAGSGAAAAAAAVAAAEATAAAAAESLSALTEELANVRAAAAVAAAAAQTSAEARTAEIEAAVRQITILDTRVRDLEERSSTAECALIELRVRGTVEEGFVTAHAAYGALYEQLHVAESNAKQVREELQAAKAQHAREKGDLDALLLTAKENEAFAAKRLEAATLAAATKTAESARAPLQAATELAEARANAALVPQLRTTIAETSAVSASWEEQFKRMRETLSTRTTAAAASAEGGGGEEEAIIPISAYLSTAEAYEAVGKERDHLLGALKAKDDAIAAVLKDVARETRRCAALQLELAAVKESVSDAPKLRAAFGALQTARDAHAAALQSRLSEATEALAAFNKDAILVTARAAEAAALARLAESDKLTHALRAAAAASEKSASDFEKRALAAERAATTERSEAQGNVVRVEKLEQKVSSLTEELKVARATALRERQAATSALAHAKASGGSGAGGVSGSGDGSELAMLRSFVYCSVCSERTKSTLLRSCGHTFCRECVDNLVTLRQRKCPSCMLGFSTGDIAPVFFI